MRLQILFPQHQADLKLNDQDWQGMRQYFQNHCDNYEHAMRMQILAAEKVEITDQGEIKLTMPKTKTDLHQEPPQCQCCVNFD